MTSLTCLVQTAVVLVQILQLYKDYIDPDFTWSNFTVEEQAKVIVAPRSNNLLDTERVSGSLLKLFQGCLPSFLVEFNGIVIP